MTSDLAGVEARIRHWENIEAIKRLKYKYFRCVDNKLWPELAECFTEDATTSYADGRYRSQGRSKIISFLKMILDRDSFVTMHHGHHPEIEITSDTTARGTWALEDYVIDTVANTSLRGAAFYYDEYVKERGEWKIRHTGFSRIFEETFDRRDIQSLKLIAAKAFPSPD